MRRAAVAARASRKRAQQLELGEDLDEVARPPRACLHEILVCVAREAGAHEDVEHVVHVQLGLPRGEAKMRAERARKIGMAAGVIFGAAETQSRGGMAGR